MPRLCSYIENGHAKPMLPTGRISLILPSVSPSQAKLVSAKAEFQSLLANKESELRAAHKSLFQTREEYAYPIALRALLDLSKTKILSFTKHKTWDQLRGTMTDRETAAYALRCLQQKGESLPQEALNAVCDSDSTLRHEGNVAAHHASERTAAAAVLARPEGGRSGLQELQQFVYSREELD